MAIMIMITISCETNACGYETEKLPRLHWHLGNFDDRVATGKKKRQKKKNLERNAEMEEASGEEAFSRDALAKF